MKMQRAFTLVELLVVIAIIALLVSILLPSMGKARNLAKLTISLSNNRQIVAASSSYKADYKNLMPMVISGGGQGFAPGWSTWSYGGKWCNQRWQGVNAGLFDQSPKRRPINTYIYPDLQTDDVPTLQTRAALELPLFRSPGDKISYQYQNPYPTPDYTLSSYDDVGTSYHSNMRWWDQLQAANPSRPREDTWVYWNRLLKIGMLRMDQAANFDPTKFVWMHDQTGDIVAHDTRRRNWMGEFGDRNKSVMTFMDGHTDYIELSPGQASGIGYTFTFPRF